MSRTPVYRNLPTLEEILGPFGGFPSGISRQKFMEDQLRAVAKKLRRGPAQTFYSMRLVCSYFTADLQTVTRVYRVLEREGLLGRIRSSRTILTGRESSAQDKIRGIVGIPIFINAIALLPFTRIFAAEMGEKLRAAGFVADFIFYHRKRDEADPEFAERLLRHRLDVVVLFTPLPECRQNIAFLRERGVRVIVIERPRDEHYRGIGTDNPAVIYNYESYSAYRKMAQRWQSIDIKKVWLWHDADPRVQGEVSRFQKLMSDHGMEAVSIRDEPTDLIKKIRRQAATKKQAIAVLDRSIGDRILNNHPDKIVKLSQAARLAFCLGHLISPYLRERSIPVDMIHLDPAEIAARLVDDISCFTIVPDGMRHTFAAVYEEQTTQSYLDDLEKHW